MEPNWKKLSSGESVEIGRKPLRPLADDGFARLDIMDTNKSMSKRHAIVSVDAQGNASVRDLRSTNGSFVVADNGQLMRLPADEDFKLPSTPMTLQFGDVRVIFERDSVSAMSESESTTSAPVSNLFSYAVSDEASQEPDAADMSVDDILNLRTGEPTALFNARNVANRVNLMQRPNVSLSRQFDPTSRIMGISRPFRWCSITTSWITRHVTSSPTPQPRQMPWRNSRRRKKRPRRTPPKRKSRLCCPNPKSSQATTSNTTRFP